MAKNKLGIDLNKFKVTKIDKDKTTLQHKDGHQVHIAHNVLSKENQAALKELHKQAESSQTDSQKQEASAPYGKVIQKYAEGTPDDFVKEIVPQAPMPKEPEPTPEETYGQQVDTRLQSMRNQNYSHLPDEQLRSKAESEILNTMVGAKDQADKAEQAQARDAMQMQQNQITAAQQKVDAINAENAKRLKVGLPALPVPEVPQMQTPSQEAQGAVQGQIAQDNPQVLEQQSKGLAQEAQKSQDTVGNAMNDSMSLMNQAYHQKLGALAAEAKAAGDLGQAQSQALQKDLAIKQQAQDAFKQRFDALETERQGFMQDIKDGHIDPNLYWKGDKNGNGGHSKIMAGIGMILAGFNPTNSPNAAVNFLKFQMEQNLKAQESNLQSKNNLLNANLAQFKNMRDAMDMTRLMQADVIQNQLATAAANAQTPLAQAAAQKAMADWKMQYAPLQQQFAMRQAIMHLGDSGGSPQAVEHLLGYLRQTNPEMAKDIEGRYVPGIGLGTIPVPQDVRTKMIGYQHLEDLAKDLLSFSKKHSTITPGTPEYNVGAQKALMLQSAIRENQLGTVYKEGEQPLLDKFVSSNPAGALKMLQTQPQLGALIQSNKKQMDLTKRSYGIPVKEPVDQSAQYLQWAQANAATNPKAAQYLKLHGGK